MPFEVMLWVYVLQNWYCCSHPMADETLRDSDAMRRFARIELGGDRISDEAVMLHFPHMPKRHGLNKAGARDTQMSSAKKGGDWYFDMMAHIGVGAGNGVTHSLETLAAKTHVIASVRACVEHPFRTIACRFGHVRPRYRCFAKNRAQCVTLVALGNLFLMRRRLIAEGRVCPKSPYRPFRRPKQCRNS